MDTRGQIRPLDEFPDDEKDAARKRLEDAMLEHRAAMEELLTPEALAKIDKAEADLEARMLGMDT